MNSVREVARETAARKAESARIEAIIIPTSQFQGCKNGMDSMYSYPMPPATHTPFATKLTALITVNGTKIPTNTRNPQGVIGNAARSLNNRNTVNENVVNISIPVGSSNNHHGGTENPLTTNVMIPYTWVKR
eukprot:TRINITY_DN44851_c0_g1_i1.p2 TRINITY_DN44851_c0_g1~~TRINITY_DN44851_c0_g1_i1.p2  ORF type:complete len:132 (-),score=6.82 TRINITY_DN44851_c0_g1_i1:246-641(-)